MSIVGNVPGGTYNTGPSTYYTVTYSEIYDNSGDQHTEALNNVSEDVYIGSPNVNVAAACARRLVVMRCRGTTMRVRVLMKSQAHTVNDEKRKEKDK